MKSKKSGTTQLSAKAIATVRDLYEHAVRNFLDDPPPDDEDFRPSYEALIALGNEIDLDFWTLTDKVGTEYEIRRLREYLKSENEPS